MSVQVQQTSRAHVMKNGGQRGAVRGAENRHGIYGSQRLISHRMVKTTRMVKVSSSSKRGSKPGELLMAANGVHCRYGLFSRIAQGIKQIGFSVWPSGRGC